ncbi:cell wall hydrolase [Halothermothrix orenii]|uniref:Cell wall hydrolase SleB domain-containing protein n=1 Tax=Halothermothrix orenii (strain H 168 / OCM 544 / DSM 9562) TaxID=373903 RepID=B8CZ83_HALOH|nr:cell wall hydrolase [Halothermothrix orenii]ACL70602.1 hypothetical protein Hore_18530 [Halothermothrix orenii H 168]
MNYLREEIKKDLGIEEKPPAYSDEELELVTRTVYAEALGTTNLERKAVTWVIRNRVESSYYPDNYEEVIREENAFESVTEKSPLWRESKAPDKRNEPEYQEINKIVKEIMDTSSDDDITHRALLFHDTNTQPETPSGWNKDVINEVTDKIYPESIIADDANQFRFYQEFR